ncbi:choice-of-anchor D domain-containing protein, partial [Pyruvatibacter sp.]|uniref:choice-of-anchor D domain-containing protein n=1 Tax=Pyruvatibacter sp. TaxID=1981328 RepID=UPI0032EF8005
DVTGGQVARTFTVNATGTSNVGLTGTPVVALAGAHAADFSVTSQPSSTTIPDFSPRTFVVTFDPSAAGLRTATVSIDNNVAGKTPYTFSIAGTGTVLAPEIAVRGNGVEIVSGDVTPAAADNTDFGGIDIVAGTQANTFTIANTGTGLLTLGANALTLGGVNAADFAVAAQPAINVAAAASTTFTVTFDPSAEGARTATVSIANDDADEAPYTFTLQGTGQAGGTITLVQTIAGPDVTTQFTSSTAVLN